MVPVSQKLRMILQGIVLCNLDSCDNLHEKFLEVFLCIAITFL